MGRRPRVLVHALNTVCVYGRDVMDAEPFAGPAHPAWASSLKGTVAGDVALVYAAHAHQGIVALTRYMRDAQPNTSWRYGAECEEIAVTPMIKRSQLLADPLIAPVFRQVLGRRSLPEDVADRLLVRFPQLARAYADLVGVRVVAAAPRGHDKQAMLDAICADAALCAQLGVDPSTERDVPVRGGSRRADLLAFSEGGPIVLVAAELECRLRALRRLLELRALITEHDDRPVEAHLIVGGAVTRKLRATVAQLADVRLWSCRADRSGACRLEVIA